MKKFYNRQSIRLSNYDYSKSGFYFITICTKDRKHLFGDIVSGKMVLNNAGRIVEKCWEEIPVHFPNVRIHTFVVMPNHIHGILKIQANDYSPVLMKDLCQNLELPEHKYFLSDRIDRSSIHNALVKLKDDGPRGTSKTLGSVIRGFKIGVTKWFRKNDPKNFPVGRSPWQRNYWDYIIRDERGYHQIALYIIDNPIKWEKDKLNRRGE
jgi:REP element-mobilizing transposase RayT